MAKVAIAGRLPQPIWFDTGLKMKDGSLRSIAAYDYVTLAKYQERVTNIEDEKGNVIERIPWRQLTAVDIAALKEAEPKPVEGVTGTPGRKKREG